MQILVQQGEKFMPAEAVLEALRKQYTDARSAGQPADFLAGFAALAQGLKDGVDGGKAPTTQAALRAASTRAFGKQKGAGASFKAGIDAASRAIFQLAGPDATGECAYCRKSFNPPGPDDITCSKRCKSRYEEGQN